MDVSIPENIIELTHISSIILQLPIEKLEELANTERRETSASCNSRLLCWALM